MSIQHQPGPAVAELQTALQCPNSTAALLNSGVPNLPTLAGSGLVQYSGESADMIVTCLSALAGHLQLAVEAKHGDVRKVAERVWRAFKSSSALGPKLVQADLIDPTSGGAPVMAGSATAWSHLSRPEHQIIFGTAVLTTLVLGFGEPLGLFNEFSREVWIAGAPGLLAGIVVLLLSLIQARGGTLVWS